MAKDILPPRPAPELGFPETSLGGYLPASRQAKAEEPRIVPPASMIALEDALDRLEETIDRETATLEAHRSADLDEINRRKSHSLLELTRMTRTLPATADQRLRRRLDRLRVKLLRNQTVLKLHLSAVQEIASLLVGALGEADSDGTYGMAR